MHAREHESLSEAMSRLALMKRYAATLSARIERIARPNEGRRLLEIGAAAGCLTIGLQQMGYQCVGIEPDAHALQTAQELSAQLAQPCLVVYGRAERIPFPDECFDIVVSNSVLEHVADIDGCFREVSRVLAPGGTFWFETASSMCPFQHEIRNFPLFGWYPNSLKTRIMIWAANKRPDWVGHTAAPAVNWFSDRTARQKLNQVGFGTIVDRWNLRRETEGGRIYAVALKVIQANPVARRLANIAVSECAYAAIKTR